MTYEEYKNNKSNKNNLFKNLLNKLFTVIIFSMIIIIISNHSPKFKSFIIDKVLNSTMDFSVLNKAINKTTNVFKETKKELEETQQVSKVLTEPIKYKDGVKYLIGENEKVLLKDSGIVTFIGKKEGYNNTIIIQQSNGYYAWYGNIEKPSIKLYDYIEKGTQIGTASDEYYYVLLKDDKPVTINE